MIEIDKEAQEFEDEDRMAEFLIKQNDSQILNNVKKWDRGKMLQSASEIKRYKIPYKVKKQRLKNKWKHIINKIIDII